jgi:hypothetical protein|tara:strand:- start:356 stop:961 length:606 start_codon:yes stop_codon:yes gene_type:complete
MAYKQSPFPMVGGTSAHGSALKKVTATTNEDGTTTKTRTRRDGSVKSVKTYKEGKTLATDVTKYRKDGSKKKTKHRPGDKSGTVVETFNKKGKSTNKHNRKEALKRNLVTAGKTALVGGTIAANLPLAAGIGAGAAVVGGGALALEGAGRVRDSINKAGKWIKKGVVNKIRTGNRKGTTGNKLSTHQETQKRNFGVEKKSR